MLREPNRASTSASLAVIICERNNIGRIEQGAIMWAQIRTCLVGQTGILWSSGVNWSAFVIAFVFVFLLAFKPFAFQPWEECRWDVSLSGLIRGQIDHFLAFLVLSLLLYRGLTLGARLSTFFALILTTLGGMCFGIAIEAAQPFVDRCCDINDLVVDTFGIVLGMLSWEAFRCCVNKGTSPSCFLRRLI